MYNQTFFLKWVSGKRNIKQGTKKQGFPTKCIFKQFNQHPPACMLQ